MRKKVTIWSIIVIAGLAVEGLALYIIGAKEPFMGPFRDEPSARALYEEMIETMRQAETLSYTSKCSSKSGRDGTYTIWMKKPNYFLVETINSQDEKCGTLVGDGNDLWIYWPGDCPLIDSAQNRYSYEKTRSKLYIRESTPIGKHSIWHKMNYLRAGVGTIIDPSTFHGYTDSIEPYLDGVRSRGTEKVDGQDCDVIEVSFMKRQRIWFLWLSRQDHLPRKLKEVVRVSSDLVFVEHWSDVTINAEMPDEKFAWLPPAGWQQWEEPILTDSLLKPGATAPDFELKLAKGGKVKLSDYKGKIVWLYIWRAGCPVCRREMCHLQELYEKYKDKDVVILGFNCADDKKIALDFMEENSATFPCVLDSSYEAGKVHFRDYRAQGVPLNYIIDREGKIVDSWYGYEEGHKRAKGALEKLGVELEDQ